MSKEDVFDTEGWEELDVLFGNYGIDMWGMTSEIINDYELNKEKQNKDITIDIKKEG